MYNYGKGYLIWWEDIMEIRKATVDDINIVIQLALLLYNDNTFNDLLYKMKVTLSNENNVVFLAYENLKYVGFAHCSLRYDYVEGTKSGNVGYLEGILVIEEYRNKGISKMLVEYCESWAKEKGCTEFASDCELNNTNSYNFHLKIGFDEANRIICFKKNLN
jgi:aminoglycoside 6'-N-acetyltransferase I